MRLLLAEDDPHLALLVRTVLAADGHDLEVFADGDAAAERLAREPAFDAAIFDLSLPGRDGVALLGLLRANPRTAEIPALVLSAHAGDADRQRALRAGADDFLAKPFELDALSAAVASLRGGRRPSR